MEVDGGKHCYQKLQCVKKWLPIAPTREMKGRKKYSTRRSALSNIQHNVQIIGHRSREPAIVYST